MSTIVEPLKKVGSMVLESWGLMMVDPLEPSPALFKDGDPVYQASIHYEGVFSGTLMILAHEKFMEKLARNLLGLDADEPLSAGEKSDSLCEMVNVLMGNYLTEAFGDDITFDLFSPTVALATEADVENFFSSEPIYGFTADEEPVAITCFIGKK